MAKHRYLNQVELDENKRKYRGRKIQSITKDESGRVHVVLTPKKGTKACF